MDAVIFILEALVVLGAIIMGTRLRRSTGSAAECLQRHPPVEAGSGGSIPLLHTLQTAAPQAEFILWGPEDVARARIHASDESVDPSRDRTTHREPSTAHPATRDETFNWVVDRGNRPRPHEWNPLGT